MRSDASALLDTLWGRYVEDEEVASHRAAEMSLMAMLAEEEQRLLLAQRERGA